MQDDVIRQMFRAHMLKTIFEGLATAALKESDRSYHDMELHESIKTSITDEDMLLLQIDHALDSGDVERFMLLTSELKGMGVLV